MDAPAIVVKMPAIPTSSQETTTMGSAMRTILIGTALSFVLSGCDVIQQRMGIVNPAAKAAQAEADGKAVGGACRQSGRAIEDCYSIYSWLPKASIYEGWRDMDAYMRDNKLETVEPQLPPVAPPGAKKKVVAQEDAAEKDNKETQDAKAAAQKH
ncbi:MAG: hypothetical protein QM739_11090 [Propionivibrio sp.]